MLTIEGNIVNIDGINRGRIEIGDNGLITSVGKETGNADVVLKEELIFPGFIDVHVHARECVDHSQDYKEDFATVGEAAINGGVVAIADMPNNPVAPVDEKSYEEKYQLTKKCPVDVLLYAGIGPKTNPFSVSFRASASESRNPLNFVHTDDKGSLRSPSDAFGFGRDDKRPVPYKAFMGKSVGDLFFESFQQLEEVLEKYSGQSVSFHCEDPKVLAENQNQSSHEKQRPPQAEVSAVDFALRMIEKYNLQGKICHCSTMEGVQKVIAAKKRGLPVTVEVTPHHLYFNAEAKLQMNPPLRKQDDCLALIEALKKGEIDYLATDHAPHTIEERNIGISGLPHLDTYGPFVTWLMTEHNFTAQDIARVCSQNPGQFLNKFINVKYGKVEEGYAGSLTVIDMKKPVKIETAMLKTKCGWSPFEGITFPGSVVKTIIKGKVYER